MFIFNGKNIFSHFHSFGLVSWKFFFLIRNSIWESWSAPITVTFFVQCTECRLETDITCQPYRRFVFRETPSCSEAWNILYIVVCGNVINMLCHRYYSQPEFLVFSMRGWTFTHFLCATHDCPSPSTYHIEKKTFGLCICVLCSFNSYKTSYRCDRAGCIFH